MESKFKSLWMATTGDTHYPELTDDIEVEVVIAGGGIAGLLAAYYLNQAGKKVAVVDAHRIASGTSDFTTAKITAAHSLKYDFLITNFGKDMAKIYAESNLWAIDKMDEILATEGIDCSFSRVNAYLFTNDDKHLDELKKEFDATQQIGLDVSYVHGPDGLPFQIREAIRYPNQAQFHPRKFLLGLSELIVNRGGLIFENSPCIDILDGKPAVITTPKGKVRAEDIILATNYPIADTSNLFIKIGQYRSYAVAFEAAEPISDDQFIGIAPHEFTVRTHVEDGQKWVILGGEMHHAGDGKDTEARHARMEQIARDHFKITEINHRWSAQDASTHDRVPLIGKMPRTDHVYMTTGYGEWGMTTSMVSAKLLTDLIFKGTNPWMILYDPNRFNLKAGLTELAEAGGQIMRGFGRRLTKRNKIDAGQMAQNEAKVGQYNGNQAAVYKDNEGVIHAVSAVCTHMGCTVNWNQAENSWDCPCHGSRFTIDGAVIHGPAVKPLEKY